MEHPGFSSSRHFLAERGIHLTFATLRNSAQAYTCIPAFVIQGDLALPRPFEVSLSSAAFTYDGVKFYRNIVVALKVVKIDLFSNSFAVQIAFAIARIRGLRVLGNGS